jgi:hypothetical protein
MELKLANIDFRKRDDGTLEAVVLFHDRNSGARLRAAGIGSNEKEALAAAFDAAYEKSVDTPHTVESVDIPK